MDRETKIKRFVQDSQSKAESLYRAGYKEGWADGYRAGKQKAEEERTEPWIVRPLKREDLKEGDEVVDGNGYVAVVTNNDTALHIVYRHNGKTWKVPYDYIRSLKKTGKNFDILCEERLPF